MPGSSDFPESGLIRRVWLHTFIDVIYMLLDDFRAFGHFSVFIIDPALVEDLRRLWQLLTTLAIY